MVVNPGGGQVHFVEVDSGTAASSLEAETAASVLDQDPSHRLGGGGEEMTSAVPWPIGNLADQTQIGLMDQRRCLERLTTATLLRPFKDGTEDSAGHFSFWLQLRQPVRSFPSPFGLFRARRRRKPNV